MNLNHGNPLQRRFGLAAVLAFIMALSVVASRPAAASPENLARSCRSASTGQMVPPGYTTAKGVRDGTVCDPNGSGAWVRGTGPVYGGNAAPAAPAPNYPVAPAAPPVYSSPQGCFEGEKQQGDICYRRDPASAYDWKMARRTNGEVLDAGVMARAPLPAQIPAGGDVTYPWANQCLTAQLADNWVSAAFEVVATSNGWMSYAGCPTGGNSLTYQHGRLRFLNAAPVDPVWWYNTFGARAFPGINPAHEQIQYANSVEDALRSGKEAVVTGATTYVVLVKGSEAVKEAKWITSPKGLRFFGIATRTLTYLGVAYTVWEAVQWDRQRSSWMPRNAATGEMPGNTVNPADVGQPSQIPPPPKRRCDWLDNLLPDWLKDCQP